MYQFVREHLRARGGRCAASDLLEAMNADASIAARLSRSQGFKALLTNMVHSREIELEGDEVVASLKATRRRRIILPDK